MILRKAAGLAIAALALCVVGCTGNASEPHGTSEAPQDVTESPVADLIIDDLNTGRYVAGLPEEVAATLVSVDGCAAIKTDAGETIIAVWPQGYAVGSSGRSVGSVNGSVEIDDDLFPVSGYRVTREDITGSEFATEVAFACSVDAENYFVVTQVKDFDTPE